MSLWQTAKAAGSNFVHSTINASFVYFSSTHNLVFIGILFIRDLMANESTFLSFSDFKDRYSIKPKLFIFSWHHFSHKAVV